MDHSGNHNTEVTDLATNSILVENLPKKINKDMLNNNFKIYGCIKNVIK